MGSSSAFLIRWINFFTMVLALLVVGFGFWMSTHNDECRRTLTIPVMGLGGVIFVISLVGFLGAWKNVSCLLWTYLIMLFLVLVAIMVFTVLAFIITNSGSGHVVPGARYKEYRLQDYSSWFVKQLNDTEKWTRLRSCLVKSDDCNNLSKRYKKEQYDAQNPEANVPDKDVKIIGEGKNTKKDCAGRNIPTKKKRGRLKKNIGNPTPTTSKDNPRGSQIIGTP